MFHISHEASGVELAAFRILFLTVAMVTTMMAQAVWADSTSTKLFNPFAGPLDVGVGLRFSADNEDVGNPFTEAHPTEAYRYSALYERYYGIVSRINDPLLKQLPSATDSDGHPLWFDGPSGDNRLTFMVMNLLGAKKFADLDRLYADWAQLNEVMADSRPKIGVFLHALHNTFTNVTDWERAYSVLEEWRRSDPRSPAGAIAEAVYWSSYAWNGRGNTYANEVTEEGWSLYRERLEREEATLKASAAYAKGIAWYRLYIELKRDLSSPEREMLALAEEGSRLDPANYTLYVGVIQAHTPRWRGSWGLVDQLIRSASAFEGFRGGRDVRSAVLDDL